MTEFSWTPGLVVLAVGLAGGVVLAWRLFRSGATRAENLDLEIRDLESRRDDLYRRLRDEQDSLTSAEVDQLEKAAARTLRDLDAARARKGKGPGGKKASPAEKPKAAARAQRSDAEGRSGGSLVGRRPLLSGFLLGAGMIAVVGALIYLAVRDTSGTAATPGTPAGAAADVPHPELDLSPLAQTEYDALTARVAEAPNDIQARKQLAVLLLREEQYFAAFEQSQVLLEMVPEDIDGLYVEAVVRLQMGQLEPAIARLDEVIAQFPGHVQALAWKGVAEYQLADLAAAITSWERAIEAAGGQHPELEEMVVAARQELAAGGSPSAGAEREVLAQAPPPPLPVALEGNVFVVEVGIAPDVTSVPSGVLFVSLRTAPGSPPIAARRIPAADFPLTLTLTSDDSMMGGALPDSGYVTARLDRDGDVSSVEAGDLSGGIAAESGATASVLLAP